MIQPLPKKLSMLWSFNLILVFCLFLNGAVMADEEQLRTNHIYQVLKAIGDNRGNMRSQNDVKDIALGVAVSIEEATLDAELAVFGERNPDPRWEGKVGDGYVIVDRVLEPEADFSVQFLHKALIKASKGYKLADRIHLFWKRAGASTVQLVGAKISSDRL